jgi:hypothetical protein
MDKTGRTLRRLCFEAKIPIYRSPRCSNFTKLCQNPSSPPMLTALPLDGVLDHDDPTLSSSTMCHTHLSQSRLVLPRGSPSHHRQWLEQKPRHRTPFFCHHRHPKPPQVRSPPHSDAIGENLVEN